MIKFIIHNKQLILHYQVTGRDSNPDWVREKMKERGDVSLKKGVFTFAEKEQIPNTEIAEQEISGDISDSDYYFVMGQLVNGYYLVKKTVLDIEHDLHLFQDMEISESTFITDDGKSIFRYIDKLSNEEIYVGGESEHAIPASDFAMLLKTFPSKYELSKYSDMRITRILHEYMETMPDAEDKFNRYMKKKEAKLKQRSRTHEYTEYEVLKYEFIRDSIKDMLDNSDGYSEKDWQKKILEFVLLIMPKYIAVLEGVPIRDSYSDPNKPKTRKCDMMLVDANGYVDLIEIKQPFSECLVSSMPYRDNHIPKRELSGTAMQVEKYIFYLNKWGQDGEEYLTKKYQHYFPKDFSIKITNPKGILIIGKSDFSETQVRDFEIIKRHYSNIVDIITYDDLLARLKNCIEMLQKSTKK